MNTKQKNSAPTLTIESNRSFSRAQAWLVFILSSSFFFYQCLLEVSPDVLGIDLINEFSVTEHRLAIFSASFYFSYALMQIPAGILLDRYGPHRLLPLAAIICFFSGILFSIAPYFFVVSIARLLMGVGSAFAFTGTLKLITNWFPGQKFTFLTGLTMAIGVLGSIFGEAPLARLTILVGWRNSILLLSIISLILSLFIFLWVKDKPIGETVSKKVLPRIEKKDVFLVLKNKQLWFAAIYTGIISIPPLGLCSFYGASYLIAKYSITEIMATRMMILILLGMATGNIVWGLISDYTKRRLPPMIVAAILSPLILGIIVYGSFLNLITLKIVLFLFGFFFAASVSCFSIAYEISKFEYSATALSVLSTLNTLSVAFALPCLGRLLDIFWGGSLSHNVRIYSVSDYQISMSFMIILMIIPIWMLFLIKETYAKKVEKISSHAKIK